MVPGPSAHTNSPRLELASIGMRRKPEPAKGSAARAGRSQGDMNIAVTTGKRIFQRVGDEFVDDQPGANRVFGWHAHGLQIGGDRHQLRRFGMDPRCV